LKAVSCGSRADVAQLVEHSLGKGEVTGSNPVISSRNAGRQFAVLGSQFSVLPQKLRTRVESL
jgi:hypothetical protein